MDIKVPEPQKCGNCLAFLRLEPIAKDDGKAISYIPNPEGICRRDPPRLFMVPNQNGVSMMSMFPSTKETFWCSQWKQDYA